MSTLKMIATVAYIIICIALVIVVLMQEGKTSGLGALSGAADSYWSKNKGRSQEKDRKRIFLFRNLIATMPFMVI